MGSHLPQEYTIPGFEDTDLTDEEAPGPQFTNNDASDLLAHAQAQYNLQLSTLNTISNSLRLISSIASTNDCAGSHCNQTSLQGLYCARHAYFAAMLPDLSHQDHNTHIRPDEFNNAAYCTHCPRLLHSIPLDTTMIGYHIVIVRSSSDHNLSYSHGCIRSVTAITTGLIVSFIDDTTQILECSVISDNTHRIIPPQYCSWYLTLQPRITQQP